MAKRTKEVLKYFSPSTALEVLDYFVSLNHIKIEFSPKQDKLRLQAGPIPLDHFDVLYPILEKCVMALGAGSKKDISSNRHWPLIRKDSLYLANAGLVAQALHEGGIKFKGSDKGPPRERAKPTAEPLPSQEIAVTAPAGDVLSDPSSVTISPPPRNWSVTTSTHTMPADSPQTAVERTAASEEAAVVSR